MESDFKMKELKTKINVHKTQFPTPTIVFHVQRTTKSGRNDCIIPKPENVLIPEFIFPGFVKTGTLFRFVTDIKKFLIK